jgi:hypothetical protein
MEDCAMTEMVQVSEPADGDLSPGKELAGAHQTMHLCGGETEPGGLAHNDEMRRLAARRVRRASQSNKGQSSKGVQIHRS